VLLELGLHNPVAAAIGYAAQSEWQLSVQLLAQLAKGLPAAGRSPLRLVQPFAALALDRCLPGRQSFSIPAPALLIKERCGVASAMVAGWSNCRSYERKTRRLLRTIVVRRNLGSA